MQLDKNEAMYEHIDRNKHMIKESDGFIKLRNLNMDDRI